MNKISDMYFYIDYSAGIDPAGKLTVRFDWVNYKIKVDVNKAFNPFVFVARVIDE